MKNSKKNWIRQRNFQVRSLFSLKGAGYGNNTGQNHKTPTIPFVGVHEPGGGIPVCFNNGIIELFLMIFVFGSKLYLTASHITSKSVV